MNEIYENLGCPATFELLYHIFSTSALEPEKSAVAPEAPCKLETADIDINSIPPSLENFVKRFQSPDSQLPAKRRHITATSEATSVAGLDLCDSNHLPKDSEGKELFPQFAGITPLDDSQPPVLPAEHVTQEKSVIVPDHQHASFSPTKTKYQRVSVQLPSPIRKKPELVLNSSVFDEVSCDGFGVGLAIQTQADVDCKDFYKKFEEGISDVHESQSSNPHPNACLGQSQQELCDVTAFFADSSNGFGSPIRKDRRSISSRYDVLQTPLLASDDSRSL